MTVLNWSQKAERIWGALAVVPLRDAAGEARDVTIGIRVCLEDDAYRVDFKVWCWPFEAIDGGVGLATLGEAKACASSWLSAACAQHSLTPSL